MNNSFVIVQKIRVFISKKA